MNKLITALSLVMIFGVISGCEQAEQAADTAAQKTESALKTAADKSDKMMQKAGQELDQAMQNAEEKSAAATDKMKNEEGNDSLALAEDMPKGAVAILHATAGNNIKGSVHFRPVGDGLNIKTTATGLSPGEHGYHIHLYGDCAAPDGTSAGTHFNLTGSSLNPPKDIDHITGNLGTLMADQNGNAEHSGKIENASLTGSKSIIGRAVIVHAKGNDHKQPPIGAAGARLACGVIGIANPQSSP